MKKFFNLKVKKLHLDRNSALALALLPGIMLMVLQQIFVVTHAYEWYVPWLDTPMHILGGATVAWATWALVSYAITVKKLPKLPFWFSVFVAVGAAALVGVLWEHYEFLHDVYLKTQEQLAQYGTADTMKDLANDLLGAFVLSILLGRKMLKK
jgi:hypothetical protein